MPIMLKYIFHILITLLQLPKCKIYLNFVLFCSLAVLDRLAKPSTYFIHLSLSSVILIDSTTEIPAHVLMLSIQVVRGLPRLRAHCIVPCIISFSRQLLCFLMV